MGRGGGPKVASAAAATASSATTAATPTSVPLSARVPASARLLRPEVWRNRRIRLRTAPPNELPPRPHAPLFPLTRSKDLLQHLLRQQLAVENLASNAAKLQSAQDELHRVLSMAQERPHRQLAQLHQWQQRHSAPFLLAAALNLP